MTRHLPQAAYDHLSPDELAEYQRDRAMSSRRAFRAPRPERPDLDPHLPDMDADGFEL